MRSNSSNAVGGETEKRSSKTDTKLEIKSEIISSKLPVTQEESQKFRKYFEMNINKNTQQNLWETAMLRGKLVALNTYVKRKGITI